MSNIKNKNLLALVSIPRSIWALGFVSLFMDASSELIHSLLPVFMVSTLGASMIFVGIVEGIAEATSLIVKIFSGTLSDYLRKRKLLTVIGYGMSTFTKPFFPLANTIGLVLSARFVDRIGKGIRDAPRDAMMGDIAPPEIRGTCFGLRQSLDTVGAFLGPLLAICGMLLLSDNIRAVLWIAIIPAFIAFIILIIGVKEPKIHHHEKIKIKIKIKDIYKIGSAYWQLVAVAGVLTLARFSEAFLILKAKDTGLSIAFVPLVMVAMNFIYAFAAYPAGIISDKVNRKTILLIGIVFLIIADIVLGFTSNLWMLTLGIIFWGMHMAFTQGLLATMVTDTTPQELRGTAYGVFNFVCGIAMLFSSIIAGVLWSRYGSSLAFFTGAMFSTIAFIGLFIIHSNHNPKKT